MDQNEKCKNAPHKSLESNSNFEELLEVLQKLTFVFDDFQHPYEPGELHKLVHSSDPCDSHDLVDIWSSKEYIKWNDCHQVNEEPSFQVLLGNNFSISYQEKIIVKYGFVKNDQNIKQEADINKAIEPNPANGVFFNECESVRHCHAGEYQYNCNVYVPYA